MADEEKTSQEQDHAPEESASEAAPEAAEAEAPDEDAPEAEAPEEPEAPEAEAEAPEEDAPDAEGAAGESDAPAAEPSDQEPERPPLTPKERRKLERSRHRGEPGPQRSPSDRAAQRAERRQDRAAERRRYRPRSRVRRAGAGEGTPPAERRPGAQKVRQGMVVSARADKTITVKVEIARRHRMYEKVVRRSATLLAHDEANRASEGDLVRVVETRPLSKTKRWRLVEILEKAR